MYIKRREFRTLDELLELGDEFEVIKNEKRPAKSSDRNQESRKSSWPDSQNFALQTNYDRKQCCWCCGKRGHRRQDCWGSLKLFCSYCGKDNIKTMDFLCEKPVPIPRNPTPATANTIPPHHQHVDQNQLNHPVTTITLSLPILERIPK